MNEENMNKFMDDFFKPWYRPDKSDDLCNEKYQVEGEDPLWEVESIVGQMGKGKNLKYLVKWKGSEKKTYEPIQHLKKYGAEDTINDYEANKKLKKQKTKTNQAAQVYMCNTNNHIIMNDSEEETVRILMNKQGKKGSVQDWIQGYSDEINNVKSKRLKEIVYGDLNDDMKRSAIPMRMILEEKRDGRKKGRLVAIGYREPMANGGRSNGSPVSDMSTIKSLLFKSGSPEDIICSIDVSVAFLQADPYPDGSPKKYVSYKPHRYARTQYFELTGPIYGLRSASRDWYETLSQWLISEGYERQVNEQCTFINKEGFTIVIYVDDIITRGKREETDLFYKKLNERFACKDSTELKPGNNLSHLGFDISCEDIEANKINHDNKQSKKDGMVRIISIDHTETVNQFLEEVGDVPTVMNINSPMANKNQILGETELLKGEDINKYQSKMGVINYYAWTLRYDIAYAASRLSQYNDKPTKGALKGLYRILSYLKATPDFKAKGLFGPKEDRFNYSSDSDHAGDVPITTCSHSGTMLMLNDVPIKWKSKKQPKTSKSSAEAEIYALSQSVDEARFLNWKLEELGVKVEKPLEMNVDNNQAISFCENLCINTRLRTTFNLKQHWIKELRDDGILKVKKVNTINNPSDLLTKSLPAYKLKQLIKLCNPIKYLAIT